jgi:structural maintenance of chromosome 4
MEKDRKALQEAQMRITALEDDLKRFTTESQQLETKHAKEEKALEAILESLKGDIGELQAQLAAAQEELAPFSKARDEAKAARDLKQAELDLVTKAVRDIDAQIEAAESGSKEVRLTAGGKTGEGLG